MEGGIGGKTRKGYQHPAGRWAAAIDRLATDDPAHRRIAPQPVGIIHIKTDRLLVGPGFPRSGGVGSKLGTAFGLVAGRRISCHANFQCLVSLGKSWGGIHG